MLTRLRHLEFNVPAARTALRGAFFPDDRWTTIHWGPLRGMKLKNRADINLHLLLGAWELRSFATLRNVLNELNSQQWDGAAIDVGANMGAYSYWLHQSLPALTAIYAFEASPETAQRLQENLTASGANNVQIIQKAVIDQNRPVQFFLSHHHHSSSIVESFAHAEVAAKNRSSFQVQGIALDSFLSDKRPPIPFIKVDIEGGAVLALPGMTQTIARHRPLVLIESHIPDEDHAISSMLLSNDYDAFRLNTQTWVKQKNADHKNMDGVWGTMLCLPSEMKSRLEPVLK